MNDSLKDYPNIKTALFELAKELNQNSIIWGIGGSLLLFLKGYDTAVNDIDIIVHSKDANKLTKILSKYDLNETRYNEKYLTEYFYNFNIGSVSIDLMINFTIKHNQKIFTFDEEKISETKIMIEEQMISLSSVSEWKKAYYAMNRKDKINLLK